MVEEVFWKVGGQQGEGIESTGDIFATALNRKGYFLYSYRQFSSRIKGGHTNNKIRVSTKPIYSIGDDLDILIAFDQETIDLNGHELGEKGIIIADDKFDPIKPVDIKARLYPVPFTQIATELGNSLMKNMVALGATAAVMGLEEDIFDGVVEEMFGPKGQAVVDKNLEALRRGAEYILEQWEMIEGFALSKADDKRRMFLIGNEAIGLGALAAGARFMAAYPITPASEIMEYLIRKLPELGGTVIQTEDEIAAAGMTIGANFAGVRALTASSGPGLSLKTESIGLASMTETPMVVINTMRGGPSTGLPTKTEQSDVMAMIYSTHGEGAKIVMAPSTVEEAFYDTIEAFNMAEEFQCPVILLTDLQLSLSKQTAEPFDYNRIKIRRGKLMLGQELPDNKGEYFKRYAVTDDGISPRVVPGMENGIHHVTGLEHNEMGKPSEAPANHRAQMDKRLGKLKGVSKVFPTPIRVDAPYDEADILLTGFSSTYGAMAEAALRLREDGVKVNHAHLRLIHPFPKQELQPLMEKAKKIVVVEQNATGQLANLIKMNLGYGDKIVSLGRYDGQPLVPQDVYGKCMEVVSCGNL